MPLGRLQIKIQFTDLIGRTIQFLVDFGQFPVNVSVIGRIAGHLSLQGSYGRQGEFRGVFGNGLLVKTRDCSLIGGFPAIAT